MKKCGAKAVHDSLLVFCGKLFEKAFLWFFTPLFIGLIVTLMVAAGFFFKNQNSNSWLPNFLDFSNSGKCIDEISKSQDVEPKHLFFNNDGKHVFTVDLNQSFVNTSETETYECNVSNGNYSFELISK